MKIKVPFLENAAIWKKADDFRKSLAPEGCDLPPINILYVADVILKLDIIELPDLFASQHIDAAILPDLSGIYIDQEELRAWRCSWWLQGVHPRLRRGSDYAAPKNTLPLLGPPNGHCGWLGIGQEGK